MHATDARALILAAGDLGKLFLALQAKNCGTGAGGFHPGNTCGRAGRHGFGKRGNRRHQKPRRIHGPEHAGWLKHQAGERREHAREIRSERRDLRKTQATERRTLKRSHERAVASLERRQAREAAKLQARHEREAAKHPGPSTTARHEEERHDLAATHHQERHDLAREHATERRDQIAEHREERRSRREDHLQSIADLRRSQRDDLAEVLGGIRSERNERREERREAKAAGSAFVKSVQSKADDPGADDSADIPTADAILALALKSPPRVDTPDGGDDHRDEDPENTYGLPDGEDIEELLAEFFRQQAREVLGDIPEIGEPLPANAPPLDHWDEPMAEAFTPLISAYWDEAGQAIRDKIGLEPNAWRDSWRVSDPHLREMIADASLAFCSSTNATTSQSLDVALQSLRQSLMEGIAVEGESVYLLTQRVKAIFEHAETYRARRIAITETARAVHQASLESVRESGVVTAKRLLVSGNACSLCKRIKKREPEGGWPIDSDMAVIGDDPHYSKIPCPPIHPGCRCSMAFATIYDDLVKASGIE